jgi:hypothetical protein
MPQGLEEGTERSEFMNTFKNNSIVNKMLLPGEVSSTMYGYGEKSAEAIVAFGIRAA